MSKRGRSPGFVMPDEHRLKIANSNILKCLIEHAVGKREMTQTQVSAGIALLRKVMPDLASVEHSGQIDTRRASEIADDQLAHIATGSSEGTAETPSDPSKLN